MRPQYSCGVWGIAAYPDFGIEKVLAVRTDGKVQIAGMTQAETVSAVGSAGPSI